MPQRVLTRLWPLTFRLALLDKDARIGAEFLEGQGIAGPVLHLTSELLGRARAALERGGRLPGADPADRARGRRGVARVTEPSAPNPSGAPILVLVAPQDIVNIASAVRLAKNFGITGIRLVNPEVFDPWRIEGIAHNTADLVARIETFSSLSDALADTVYSVALTARGRAAKRTVLEPREAATELVAQCGGGSGGDGLRPRRQGTEQ